MCAQVQLMRAHGMAAPLLEEVDAELASVWRFILEREVEAPERFQVTAPARLIWQPPPHLQTIAHAACFAHFFDGILPAVSCYDCHPFVELAWAQDRQGTRGLDSVLGWWGSGELNANQLTAKLKVTH
jgi:hypothetical protein